MSQIITNHRRIDALGLLLWLRVIDLNCVTTTLASGVNSIAIRLILDVFDIFTTVSLSFIRVAHIRHTVVNWKHRRLLRHEKTTVRKALVLPLIVLALLQAACRIGFGDHRLCCVCVCV